MHKWCSVLRWHESNLGFIGNWRKQSLGCLREKYKSTNLSMRVPMPRTVTELSVVAKKVL